MSENSTNLKGICSNDMIVVTKSDLETFAKEVVRGLKKEIADDATCSLMTAKEVCSMLNISTATLWRLCNDGDLRVIKVAGCSRYRRADVEKFLQSCLKRKCL